jgi:hypothetical protein
MPMLLILAACMWVLQTHLVSIAAFERSSPQALASASDEVDHYRAFLYLAHLYMKTHLPSSDVLDLRASDLMPGLAQAHGMSAEAFPSNWHLVVASNTRWATCTPMSEEALGLMAQSIKTNDLEAKMVLQTFAGGRAWVIGQDASAGDLCH